MLNEVNIVGEVYKPEDLVGGKRKTSDLSPGLSRVPPTTIKEIIKEIRFLKTEIKKIKHVLRANGIIVEVDL